MTELMDGIGCKLVSMVGRIEGVGLLFGIDGGMGLREGGREVTESLNLWMGWMVLVWTGWWMRLV
jgi:hypothetical protein